MILDSLAKQRLTNHYKAIETELDQLRQTLIAPIDEGELVAVAVALGYRVDTLTSVNNELLRQSECREREEAI